jgi:acyl transferase domain-containing protein
MLDKESEYTALLIPGLDAIFSNSQIKKWLALDSVKQSLSEASVALAEVAPGSHDLCLEKFLSTHTRPYLVDFNKMLIVVTAVQVGIIRELRKKYGWSFMVGCSHGDFARSIEVGTLTYRDAVDVIWSFGSLREKSLPGITANVRRFDREKLTEQDLQWIKSNGGWITMWSDFHATVSGLTEDISLMQKESDNRGLKLRPMLEYPVHSPVMKPVVDLMMARAKPWQVQAPKERVFSTVFVRELFSAEEMISESIAGALNPIRWQESVLELKNHMGIRRFLNVGPSTTLTDWLSVNIEVLQADACLLSH